MSRPAADAGTAPWYPVNGSKPSNPTSIVGRRSSPVAADRFMQHVYTTFSAEETMNLGRELAQRVHPPQLVLLVGDLGAGKTTLAKGLIEGLGAAEPDDVLSPTFSLIHEYEGDPKVYHIDLYRLDQVPEFETLGLDELWEENAVVLIEWGEKFTAHLPTPRLQINLEDQGEDKRLVTVIDPED